MAISATTQTLHDGARNVVMQFTGVSDGAGQENRVVKVDASTLSPPAGTGLKIRKITYDIGGPGHVELFWAADDPVRFATLALGAEFEYCLTGGLRNNGGAGANGDILLSTEGFELGSSYSVTLEMVKT